MEMGAPSSWRAVQRRKRFTTPIAGKQRWARIRGLLPERLSSMKSARCGRGGRADDDSFVSLAPRFERPQKVLVGIAVAGFQCAIGRFNVLARGVVLLLGRLFLRRPRLSALIKIVRPSPRD